MRLGIVTDIHEHAKQLKAAIDVLKARCVDQIVVVGDIFSTGEHIEETCDLLASAGVVGVWGNHDFGLCHQPERALADRYSEKVLRYMASLEPRYEIADCHFMHIEPWLDPYRLDDLWYYDGMPESPDRLSRIFASVSNRWLFAGHYHRWLAATPQRVTDWRGNSPLEMSAGRYFVVIAPVFSGDFAIFDTEACELTPCKTGLPSELE